MTRGISVEAFAKRIGEANQMVYEWPFGDLAPSENYVSDAEIHSKSAGIVVGEVSTVFGKIGSISVHGQHPVMLSNLDPAINWQQLSLVSLVMSVNRDPDVPDDAPYPYFVPERILAVEPPLTNAETARARWLGKQGGGYVHGVVARSSEKFDTFLRGGILNLTVPEIGRTVFLDCSSEPMLTRTGGGGLTQLQKGDIVRAKVAPGGAMLDTYKAGFHIVKLGEAATS